MWFLQNLRLEYSLTDQSGQRYVCSRESSCAIHRSSKRCGYFQLSLLPDSYYYRSLDKTPLERAKLLEKTPLFADIHAEMASTGQSAVPSNLDTDLHFTCFVEAPSADSRKAGLTTSSKRVIELDGSREGPVDHGPCAEDDFLQVRWHSLWHSLWLNRNICRSWVKLWRRTS